MTTKIGLVGGGVVGGGVVEILAKHGASVFSKQLGINMSIAKVAVRDVAKKRDFTLPEGCELVGNVFDVVTDPSIDIVCEVMGGVTVAKEVVMRAIEADKHVVTANKALVASCLDEIEAALKEHPNVRFCYEAAVCGGIPIINGLQSSFLGDHITEVQGIMNGTTNYMLTKMSDEGASYAAALAEAQRLGYAEADPTADVEGLDVQAKLALLTKLAFGKTVAPAAIPTAGISAVDAVDFHFAKALGATVKLLGTARRVPMGGGGGGDDAEEGLAVFVGPTMVPLTHPLAAAPGATNVVHVSSENLGRSTFVGPGAGRFPTANSVVNDLLRVAGMAALAPFPRQVPSLALSDAVSGKFYVRVTVAANDLGVVASLGASAQAAGCPITSLLPASEEDDDAATGAAAPRHIAITTGTCLQSQVTDMCALIGAQPFVEGAPVVMGLI